MNHNQNILKITLIYLILSASIISAQQIYDNPNHRWEPAEDNVYLQEVSQKIFSDNPVQSVAEFNKNCYVAMNNEIYLLKDNSLVKLDSAPSKVSRLIKMDNMLWALTEYGLFRLNESWEKLDDQKFVDLCMHLGSLYAATRDDVFRFENNKFVNIEPAGGYYSSNMTMLMEDGTQLLADPVRIGPIHRIASYSETLYILRPGEVSII